MVYPGLCSMLGFIVDMITCFYRSVSSRLPLLYWYWDKRYIDLSVSNAHSGDSININRVNLDETNAICVQYEANKMLRRQIVNIPAW